ncbi:MAG: response regulator [Candidatus Bathyarchaeota archaeon]
MMKDKASILIVDDDANIRETLETILQQKGYNTDIAKNGREAIKKSKTKFFNLALLDIKLPDMEGTELLITIHETIPKMVKIMVTGYPNLENAVDSLNHGADAYVIKPFKTEKLLELIEEKLEKQSQTEKMTQEKLIEWIKTRLRKIEGKKRAGKLTDKKKTELTMYT